MAREGQRLALKMTFASSEVLQAASAVAAAETPAPQSLANCSWTKSFRIHSNNADHAFLVHAQSHPLDVDANIFLAKANKTHAHNDKVHAQLLHK